MLLPISEIIKQAAVSIGLDEPSGTIYSSTDKDVKILLQFALETGREIKSNYFIPELKKSYTITTTTSVQYPLPGDFERMIPGTQWDTSNNWMMGGPLSDQEWNAFQYGIVTSLARKRFKVFGSDYNAGQIYLDPAPDSGDVIAFDYIRDSWFVPKQWASGQSVSSGTSYRFASGNIYLAQSTGTTGSTVPSHTSGTVSDGSVNWLYVTTQVYSTTGKFLADDDFPLIEGELIIMGIVWRYLKRKGLDFSVERKAYYDELNTTLSKLPGAPILRMSDGSLNRLLSYDNIPEGNYDL